ncbi:MAG: hypothetical protein ACXVHM_01665, partial [Methanobacterium sp.]
TTSALLEKFRKERVVVQEKSKETLGNLFERLDKMERKIDEMKSETGNIKEIKSEIEELKEILKK